MVDSDMDVSDVIGRRPLWRRGRVWGSIVAIGLVAGLGYYGLVGRKATVAAPTTQEVKVTLGSLATTLSASGTAAAEQSTPLTFSTGGVVTEVLVHLGDEVKTGQPLIRVDARDAQRKLASAQSSLVQAQLRLNLLLNPNAVDRATSQQSLVSSRTQLDNAQAAYDNLGKPTATDVAAAQASLISAQAGIQSAQNSVDSSRASLQSAQNSYCSLAQETTVGVCTPDKLPISPDLVAILQASSARGSTVPSTNLISAVSSLISSNASYVNALAGRDTAKASLASAQAKYDALTQPTSDDRRIALAALQNAQASYDSAAARADALLHPAAVDVGLQQQSVQTAQIALDQAQDSLNDATLTAPFGGKVGTVAAIVGQRIGGGTAAVTLSNPDAIRIDLTIAEADLVSVKAGMLGLARFDSLPRNAYVVKVIGVSSIPTVTQGVVTYPVQAAILRGAALNDIRDQLPSLASALTGGASGAQFGALLGTGGGAGAGAGTRAPGAGAAGGTGGAAGAGAGAGAGTGQRPQGSGTPGQRPQGSPDGTRPAGTPTATGTPSASPTGTPTGTTGGAATAIPDATRPAGAGIQALLNPPLPTAGMNASVTLLVSVVENQLLVPTGAVRRQGNQSFVYTPGAAGGAPVQKQVVTAGTDGTNTAITSGLAEGDVVILGAIGTATPARSGTATGTAARPGTAPAGGPPGGPGGGGGGVGGIR